MQRFIKSAIFIAALAFPVVAIAAPFDPEAATQAYLATLSGAARAKSDAYFEGGYWLILWGMLVSILVDLFILRSGWSAKFRDWAEGKTSKSWLQSALYSLPYMLAGLIALPWIIYTQFFREKSYGLMNQSFAGWLGDFGLDMAISIVVMLIIFPLAVKAVRASPKRWWLWGSGFASLFLAFAVLIAPVFVKPLFNKYTEMPAGPVRDRIVAMAQSKHIPAEHIYVFNASKQSDRISANVSGIGPTIRISLNDNLLNRSTPAEIASVMGHEMGHYVLGHIWKLILSFTFLLLISFWIAAHAVPSLVNRYGKSWGLRGPLDLAAIPVYSIVITAAMFVLTPLTNTLIRTHESEADAFGLDVAREPDGFASTAMKLSQYRKIEPGPVEEMLFYDHPSGATRIRMAMAWKAAHLAEIEARAKPSAQTAK